MRSHSLRLRLGMVTASSSDRRIGFDLMRDDFSFCNEETSRKEYPMSVAETIIPPQLPPVSVLSPVPLRRPGTRSETMAEDGREQFFERIVGRSEALQRALREVEVVAPTDSGVLILGETGTGKELVARAIHNLSTRRGQPLIKL